METKVMIVGGGPAGLATAACLNRHSISNVVLEKDDCYASLWKYRTYDRLGLHLAKEFCTLPYMHYPPHTPTFVPKKTFMWYLKSYVCNFKINPLCSRTVISATYNGADRKWFMYVSNTKTGEMEFFVSEYLVVATGDNGEPHIPRFSGLDTFKGEVLHSSQYKSGWRYKNKRCLVVGCGNSGMEICYDLALSGALDPSIVVRNPVHFLTKEMVHLGMVLLKYLPIYIVDTLVTTLSKIKYGDLSSYGLRRPEKGPFFLKATTGRSPIIDVGTISMIRNKEIKVVPAVKRIDEKQVVFEDGSQKEFDFIMLATGYKSTTNQWLKDYEYILNEEGIPKNKFPKHWKGEKGVYCAGLSRRGLAGVSSDAIAIADDIKSRLST